MPCRAMPLCSVLCCAMNPSRSLRPSSLIHFNPTVHLVPPLSEPLRSYIWPLKFFHPFTELDGASRKFDAIGTSVAYLRSFRLSFVPLQVPAINVVCYSTKFTHYYSSKPTIIIRFYMTLLPYLLPLLIHTKFEDLIFTLSLPPAPHI